MNSLATIIQPIIAQPTNAYTQLHQAELAMIRAWRKVASDDVILKVKYQASIPEYVDWFLDNRIQEQEPSQTELTPFEIEVINTGRQLSYGELQLLVSQGQPILILGDSFKRIKLNNRP